MNISRIIGIAVVVASILEFVTRGRLGPAGMVIALVIAVIISWNLPGRRPIRDATGDPRAQAGAPSGSSSPDTNDPYALLGIRPGCSDDELTRAYHTLVKQWHPDQLEGMAPELREHANYRLAQINQAFDLIRRSRRGHA